MNGNDLVQWAIYIQMKIMLGKDLVKLEIFMKTKTIIGNDQVKVRYILGSEMKSLKISTLYRTQFQC